MEVVVVEEVAVVVAVAASHLVPRLAQRVGEALEVVALHVRVRREQRLHRRLVARVRL